jgi:hypothetical protein
MSTRTKLELTWVGKDHRPRLEPSILIEDKALSYRAPPPGPAQGEWMKPAPGQFRIEWQAGRNYEPDFVVELSDRMLLIEPKQEAAMNQQDTQDKARAAVRWCSYASKHARSVGGKPWHYLLVPDAAIVSAASIRGLAAMYECGNDA